MKKQMLNLFRKGIATITVALMVMTPTTAMAASSTTVKDYTSILSVVAQRYKDIKNYKEYIGSLDTFIDGIDSSMPVDDAKSQILEYIETSQVKYSSTTSISRVSTQMAMTTLTSDAETTPSLLTEIVSKLQSLLGSNNLSLQSLTPDVVVENKVTAKTAGDLCGAEYEVDLVGKIYYASVNENNQPTSTNWVVLLHGVMMNGQAMADSVGQMYLDRGYNILAIDSRGHGDSEGRVAMGYLESLDVWDWLTYLNGNYLCDNIIIHGVSLGGATTVFTSGLTVNGETLKSKNVIGLVEDCGYTSLTGIIKGMLGGSSDSEETVEEGKAGLLETILGATGISDLLGGQSLTDSLIKTLLINLVDVGLTEENFDDYQSGLESFKKCELPVLIIHGTKDTTVPYENSDILYNTAISADSKIPYVQRFVAEGEPHAFITVGSKYNVYEGHINNFIDKAESIAEGKTVEKISNYQEEEEEETTLITTLVRVLKLIKNMIG